MHTCLSRIRVINKLRQAHTLLKYERGIVLVIALFLISGLSLLGIAANQNTVTDTAITSNYVSSLQSFYLAEAGVELAKSYVKYDLVNDNKNWANAAFKFPYHTSGQSMTVTCAITSTYCTINAGASGVTNGIPSATTTKTIGGAAGSISIALRNISSSVLGIRSTGAIGNSATSTIEVLLRQRPLLQYGVFGDKSVDMKANGKVYSYDSSLTPNPDPANYPANSTHKGDIGSNESVVLHNDTYVDGSVGLGKSEDGTNATYSEGGATVTGGSPNDVARVTPDPLGAIGGALEATFTSVSSSNDNGTASPAITGNKIDTKDTITLTGKSGGANYYLTSLTLKNGGVLTIDATAGPVNIYLAGSLNADNGSSINLNGVPTDFTVYCNAIDMSGSNSVVFKNSGAFKGVVYAPHAGIEMKNSADVFGLIWGSRVDIKNGGQFFFDAALNNKFLSSDYDVIAWRQVR